MLFRGGRAIGHRTSAVLPVETSGTEFVVRTGVDSLRSPCRPVDVRIDNGVEFMRALHLRTTSRWEFRPLS